MKEEEAGKSLWLAGVKKSEESAFYILVGD